MATDDVTERWLPVPGYEGLYEVSNFGRVRSLPKRTRSGTRILKLTARVTDRYLVVSLCKNGVRVRRVHQLVLEAFAGPCPSGLEALHGPGGRQDNRWPENLRWGTKPENSQDRFRDGTDARGEGNGRHVLTEDNVRAIRCRRAAKVSQKTVAAEFGVSIHTIRDIDQGKRWAWLE